MGLWAARHWFAELSDVSRVTLCDLETLSADARSTMADVPASIDSARARYGTSGLSLVDCEVVDSGRDPVQVPPELENIDLVVLATPLSVIESVMDGLNGKLAQGAWLIDMASVKSTPLEQMTAGSGDGVSVVGTHPLFGITGDSVSGRTVALVPTDSDDGQLISWLDNGLKQLGASTLQVTARKHDRYMLIAQTMTHFALMAFGEAVTRSLNEDESLEELREFGTPPYLAMGNVTGRLLVQNHRLYASIQQAEGADDIRDTFAQAARQLADSFDQGSLGDIEAEIGQLAERYGTAELEASARLSEKMFRADQSGNTEDGI
jgi:prephenate dehydrogenase